MADYVFTKHNPDQSSSSVQRRTRLSTNNIEIDDSDSHNNEIETANRPNHHQRRTSASSSASVSCEYSAAAATTTTSSSLLPDAVAVCKRPLPDRPISSLSASNQVEIFNRNSNLQRHNSVSSSASSVQASQLSATRENQLGIIHVPPGCQGIRSLYLRRENDSFGFTLRHFILFHPEEISTVAVVLNDYNTSEIPLETIFVKEITCNGPAEQAGLKPGDRLVALNGINLKNHTYAQVIQMIKNGPDYIHLLVISKDDDILQKHYANAVYHPESNQKPNGVKRIALKKYRRSSDTTIGSNWDTHFYSNSVVNYLNRTRPEPLYDTVAADSDDSSQHHIYSEIKPRPRRYHDYDSRIRRKSECSSDYESLASLAMLPLQSSGLPTGAATTVRPNAVQTAMSPATSSLFSQRNISNLRSAGCRLSLDAGNCSNATGPMFTAVSDKHFDSRRESLNSTTTSNGADVDDQFSSIDSITSTLTSTTSNYEVDDSIRLSRLKRDFERKSAFLRQLPAQNVNSLWPSPTSMNGSAGGASTGPNSIANSRENVQIAAREFYSRPHRIHKDQLVWPPPASSSASALGSNQQRSASTEHRSRSSSTSSASVRAPSSSSAASSTFVNYQTRTEDDNHNNSTSCDTHINRHNNLHLPNVQYVSKMADQFDKVQQRNSISSNGSGAGGCGGSTDSMNEPPSKTDFYRSELARLSTTNVVPSVNVRRNEYETLTTASTTTAASAAAANARRRFLSESNKNDVVQRDGNSGSNLSGNRMVIIGNKNIHCEPPPLSQQQQQQNRKSEDKMDCSKPNYTDSLITSTIGTESGSGYKPYNKPAPPIISITPAAISAAAPEPAIFAQRPNSLALKNPLVRAIEQSRSSDQQYRQQALLAPPPPPPSHTSVSSASSSSHPSLQLVAPPVPKRNNQHAFAAAANEHLQSSSLFGPSQNDSNIPVVVRRNKNSNLNSEDRATRRISYLKATWGDRMNFDSDLEFSDPEYSPKSSKKSSSNTSTKSLTRDDSGCCANIKELNESVVREGYLQCKLLEFDGKKASDRSWKQVWVALQGVYLCLYKDRNFQSPMSFSEPQASDNSTAMNTSSSGLLATTANTTNSLQKQQQQQSSLSSSSRIDMRYAVVSVADDYTKRKNVIRITATKPYRTELLLHADTAADMADWIRSFNEHVVTNSENEVINVKLEPEQQSQQPQSQQQQRLKTPQIRTRSPSGQSPVSKSLRKSSELPSIVAVPASSSSPSPVLAAAAAAADSQLQPPVSSPKPKNWRNRMVKQFKKMQQHGSSNPSSPTTNSNATGAHQPAATDACFGSPLESCVPASVSDYVPRLIEICTDLVESKGLDVKGIYRVPGNSAAVNFLTDSVNKGLGNCNLQDPRWNDMNVVGSLLKSFLRKLPDSLLTTELYSSFIEADKIEDHYERLIRIRKLIQDLPIHNFETLKFLIKHLQKVSDNSHLNKMEARNIAIVFGPTLVRDVEDNMVTMVTDMSHQCRIVESLILYADWFFADDSVAGGGNSSQFSIPPSPVLSTNMSENDLLITASSGLDNHNLLLGNISKVENFKQEGSGHKKDIVSSILSAANRKMQRKSRKSSACDLKNGDSLNSVSSVNMSSSSNELLDNCGMQLSSTPTPTPTGSSITAAVSSASETIVASAPIAPLIVDPKPQPLPAVEQPASTRAINEHNDSVNSENTDPQSMTKKDFVMSYANLTATTQERIRKFEQETKAQLSKPRVLNLRDCKLETPGVLGEKKDCNLMEISVSKINEDRHDSLANPFSNVPFANKNSQTDIQRAKTVSEGKLLKQKSDSLESLHKVTLNDCKRSSLELSDEGSDLVHQITSTFDRKLKSLQVPTKQFETRELPEAMAAATAKKPQLLFDSSKKQAATVAPVSNPKTTAISSAIGNPTASPKLFRNPSLHKNFEETVRSKSAKDEMNAKTAALTASTAAAAVVVERKSIGGGDAVKLKRSESLNKTASSLLASIKIRRAESLNKSDKVIDKLKKFDSFLTKSKKIGNCSSLGGASATGTTLSITKLKKRSGTLSSKSIKRRHTVGGTKDFDNVDWLERRVDNGMGTTAVAESGGHCYPHENYDFNNIIGKKGLRSSSPDLSTANKLQKQQQQPQQQQQSHSLYQYGPQSHAIYANGTGNGTTSRFLSDVQDDLIALLKQHFSKPVANDRNNRLQIV